jgi:3-phosphoshikimate 1-carboxyvinyltransferase
MAVGKAWARVHPVEGPLGGRVALPGSKSVTNRALLLAALANGTSLLSGVLRSDDTRHMTTALRAMGVTVADLDDTTVRVTGTGRLLAPDGALFLGNAGTAMRFLAAAAATVAGSVVLDGDAHMRKRPIGPLVAALGALGVRATDTAGCPPVTIEGRGGFVADRVEIDGRLSSQFVSAVLMAAACGTRPLDVHVAGGDIGARGYIDVTLAQMRRFGAEVAPIGPLAWRVAATGYRPVDGTIEPDASAATYLWAAEVLTGGAIDLGVVAADISQPDARAWDIIRTFPHLPPVIDGSQMQDAVPTLAVLAAFNRTPVRFVGIANLRVKECDRIRALSTELSRIRPGLAHEEGDDLVVASDPALAGQVLPAEIHTYADHRIAMSFALAALKIGGLTILDPGCVAKTYPKFWHDLASVGAVVDLG